MAKDATRFLSLLTPNAAGDGGFQLLDLPCGRDFVQGWAAASLELRVFKQLVLSGLGLGVVLDGAGLRGESTVPDQQEGLGWQGPWRGGPLQHSTVSSATG